MTRFLSFSTPWRPFFQRRHPGWRQRETSRGSSLSFAAWSGSIWWCGDSVSSLLLLLLLLWWWWWWWYYEVADLSPIQLKQAATDGKYWWNRAKSTTLYKANCHNFMACVNPLLLAAVLSAAAVSCTRVVPPPVCLFPLPPSLLWPLLQTMVCVFFTSLRWWGSAAWSWLGPGASPLWVCHSSKGKRSERLQGL